MAQKALKTDWQSKGHSAAAINLPVKWPISSTSQSESGDADGSFLERARASVLGASSLPLLLLSLLGDHPFRRVVRSI